MPYVLRPSGRRVIRAACAAVLALAAVPAAAAAASCPVTPVSKAFAQFGDAADYSLVPNGHFEAGTSGWSLSRASVVAGNESYKVRAASDARSLSIGSGGSAVSPKLCVGAEHPTFRFFARRTSTTFSTMNVKLRWVEGGQTRQLMVASLSSDRFASWTPTPSLLLAQALPGVAFGNTYQVQLVFEPAIGAGWAIDDVYVDPYRR